MADHTESHMNWIISSSKKVRESNDIAQELEFDLLDIQKQIDALNRKLEPFGITDAGFSLMRGRLIC